MPRLTKPLKPGQPYALSGRGCTANLDQLSLDRLAWLRLFTERVLKAPAGTSVLIRRAIAYYIDHTEQLLAAAPEQREREVAMLSHAARGDTDAIPDDELLAVPIKAFSVISDEAAEARRIAGIRETKAFMDQCMAEWDDKARGLGFDV
jgi:hypothetical protein